MDRYDSSIIKWIDLGLAIGKHTDQLLGERPGPAPEAKELVNNGILMIRMGMNEFYPPPSKAKHIGAYQTQQLEGTNGMKRQQIGRWHRRQNKFGKVWEQTKITIRLAIA